MFRGAATARPEQPTADEGVMQIKCPGTALNTRRHNERRMTALTRWTVTGCDGMGSHRNIPHVLSATRFGEPRVDQLPSYVALRISSLRRKAWADLLEHAYHDGNLVISSRAIACSWAKPLACAMINFATRRYRSPPPPNVYRDQHQRAVRASAWAEHTQHNLNDAPTQATRCSACSTTSQRYATIFKGPGPWPWPWPKLHAPTRNGRPHNYMQPAWNLTQVTAGRMQLHCSCVTWIRMRLSWSGAGSGAAAQQH